MPKKLLVLLVALLCSGWYVFDQFEFVGLDQVRLHRRQKQVEDSGQVTQISTSIPAAQTGETVRIATFNIQGFGDRKSAKPHVMEYLANIIRRFDVVAIQEIRTKSPDHMSRFVDLINSTGRRYDYVIGERLGRSSSKEQYAFVFDQQTVEVDRTAVYTIYDRDDALHREPLVAQFRVRGPPSSESFTFKLINVHTDSDETAKEMDTMDDVYYAVAQDGSGEDDLILLGDFSVNYRQIGQLANVADVSWIISGQETNTRKNKSYDNIFFSRRATTEFMGRGGVMDFMREFNLSLPEALEISDHMPVWVECSIYEGGQAGMFAAQPSTVR